MEGVATPGQLAEQDKDSPELDGSSPITNLRLQSHVQLLHSPQHHHRHSGCFLNLEDNNPVEDGFFSLINSGGKPENFRMLECSKLLPPTKRPRKDRTRGKFPATTSLTESMEQQIWKEFPEDLFEAVIARLPVATFFRFRSVCKKWNSLLNSQSFSQKCAQVPRPLPWFYTKTPEDMNVGAIYDPALKKWHRLAIPGLSIFSIPVASAGGLVCFLDSVRTFYVCNPLTQSVRKLPHTSFNIRSAVAFGMTLNNGKLASGGYKMLMVSRGGEYEVYNSIKNSWTRLGPVPGTIKLPLFLKFSSQAVSVEGTVYFMRYDPYAIVSYNMNTGAWKQFLVPAPLHLRDYTLAECEGRVMLVGLLTKNAATCVCIWELQKMTLLWKEVDRMPNIWCLEYYGKQHIRMTCLGGNGLFMLSLKSKRMNRVVLYNALTREWLKIPGGIPPRWKKQRDYGSCGIAFQPCPMAVA